nr:BatD family protein [Lysobacter chinensis]
MPWLLCTVLLATVLDAAAATRAWLDRDRIELGETVTLNVETDALTASPDYAPLRADFDVSGHSSRRGMAMGSQGGARSLFAVALRPRRDGVLTVPSLRVGNERTAPLSLVVVPTEQRPLAGAGEDVFIESGPDHERPYVQQSVGWVVRLYAAVPIVTGSLDQPAPDGAAFQRVGDDAQYSRTVAGRQYQVIERRFLLVPERSGELRVPGATFQGRGAAGFFDDMFGGGRGDTLQARADARTLDVQAIPAQAPQPWLPLHDLQLRYRANPSTLRQGHAATLAIEVIADGATASQMPELELPPIDGVQVFAERPQVDETFVDGRPRVKSTRSFSLVPDRSGEVRLSGVEMDWWDVGTGKGRSATLPPLRWTVQAGTGASAAALAEAVPADAGAVAGQVAAPASGDVSVPGAPAERSRRYWALAAALFAALWLLTLLWALHQRTSTRRAGAEDTDRPNGRAGTTKPTAEALRKALDTGSFDDVADLLCAMATPPAGSVDALAHRLDDPGQRAALEAMQRARWADGDGREARARLREAFAEGPRWVATAAPADAPLPPLYPPG